MSLRIKVFTSLLKTLWPNLTTDKIQYYLNKSENSTVLVEIVTHDQKQKRTITFRSEDYTMVDYRDGTIFEENQQYSDFANGWVSDNFEKVKKEGNTTSRIDYVN